MATAFTMEQSFYTDRLIAAGLSPIIPNESDRAETHRIIYEELCKDITTARSTAAYVAIANRLAASGADSLILGCTEVGMLLNQGNVAMPVFDTTLIHCKAVLITRWGDRSGSRTKVGPRPAVVRFIPLTDIVRSVGPVRKVPISEVEWRMGS